MATRQPVDKRMGGRDWGLLVLLSLLWGGSFFFVGVAVVGLPPFTIVLLRVGLAALALNGVLLATGLRLPWDGRVWGAFALMGFLNNLVPFSLIVWGQTQIASGLASILNATTPLFTVLLAHVLTRDEKLSGARFAGVVIGFAGVVVMIGPEAFDDLSNSVLAQLAIVGAALSYGFAAVFGRRFARLGVAPLSTATGMVSVSTLMLIPLVGVVDRPWELPMPGMDVWAAILGLALFSTALAYILYFRILASVGATNLSIVTFLIPVSAILLGALFLGERLGLIHFAGMALIGVGLAAIDGRLWPHFWRGIRDGNRWNPP